MSDKQKEQLVLSPDCLAQVIPQLEESNRLARKRNRLAKKQYQQSLLNYEQVERQYLIEKSHLQPRFKLSVTEFLTCEPDFVNDPEQAGEAKFLSDLGIQTDERALRIKLEVKGDAEYMQPSIVMQKGQDNTGDERVMAMTNLLYFVTVDSLSLDKAGLSIDAFFVYRDKTTLPVIHKYGLVQRRDSALLRWDVSHLDTVFVSSHKDLDRLNSSAGCADFFINR